MAVGQAVLTGGVSRPVAEAVHARLEAVERARHALHAQAMRDAVLLAELDQADGHELSTVAELALVWGCSERLAQQRLSRALLLGSLPGAFDAVEQAVLTTEVSGLVADVLEPVDPHVRQVVWQRLRTRLEVAARTGTVLPRPRVAELLRRWIVQADPDGAAQRRRAAQRQSDVDYRRRDDGLVDLFASGLPGPVAQACLQRIADRARPWGAADDRPAGQRRAEALVDLILGRPGLPLDAAARADAARGDAARADAARADAARADAEGADPDRDVHAGAGAGGRCCAGGCGCPWQSPVPCGAQVSVLVPLGAALGTTDETAEVVGHGPIEPDLLGALLAADPRLRAVWVDEHGTPVADDPRVLRPGRDPAALTDALHTLAASRPDPDRLVPRHPDDHPPHNTGRPPDTRRPDRKPPDTEPRDDGAPPTGRPPRVPDVPSTGAADAAPQHPRPAVGRDRSTPAPRPLPDEPEPDLPAALQHAADTLDRPDLLDLAALRNRWQRPARPHLLSAPHPTDQPGPYHPPATLRRLLQTRRPRCEWPGCGTRATACDLDHDLAHPHGPTCGCNLGPLCRRHHRIKQTGWTKHRRPDSTIAWTSPTRRTWTSPTPHDPPARPSRTPAPRTVNPLDELSPPAADDERTHHHPADDDRNPPSSPPDQPPPITTDTTRDHILRTTTWGLDLHDPYLWQLPRDMD